MPIILAFLAKDWKYVVIIAALLGAVGYVYHRGEAHVEVADARTVAAAIVHNNEVSDEIKTKVAAAVADYDALSPIPVPARVPVLVCHASDYRPVSKGTVSAVGSDSAGAGVSVGTAQADAGFDPAQAVSDTGTEADAEIDHLQKKVKLLQDLVKAYQGAGLVAK